jgi:LysR family transcriptional regulator, salicylic acid-responsive activator of bsdBCD
LDMKRLMYFCTIVEQGQISRAAKILNISQPPLSLRLKELEDELGVELIIRKGHIWQVTEAGVALYERARQALSLLTEIPTEVRNAAGGFTGRISLGVSMSFTSYFTEVVPKLSSKFTLLQFRVFVSDSTTLEELVESRKLDFAIVLLPTKKEIFDVQPLSMDHFCIVYPAGLLPGPGDGTFGVKVLQDIPLMLLRLWHGGRTYDQLRREFQRLGIAPRILLDSPNVSVILGALDDGVRAAAILPLNQISRSFRERYQVRRLEGILDGIQPAIIHLPDRCLTPATLEVMREVLSGRVAPDL